MDDVCICKQCGSDVTLSSCDCQPDNCDFVEEEGSWLEFCPIECPKCGGVVFILNEDGKHDFECICGFKDIVTLEQIK